MKPHILAIALIGTSLAPVCAWSQTAPAPETEQGFSLIEEGTKLLLRGLLAEVEPSMKDMGDALQGIEPALKELQPKLLQLMALIDDLQNYQAPERLENGDIIIRRRPDVPALPTAPENGQIDL